MKLLLLIPVIWVVCGKVYIFHKLNKNVWTSLIPGYSEYVIAKHLWEKELFFVDIILGMGLVTTLNVVVYLLFLGGHALFVPCLHLVGSVLFLEEFFLLEVVLYKSFKAPQHNLLNGILSTLYEPICFVPSLF